MTNEQPMVADTVPDAPSESVTSPDQGRLVSVERVLLHLALGALTVILGACEPEQEAGSAPWTAVSDHTEQFFEPDEEVQLSLTQALYVPVYSNVLTGEGTRPTEMAATLAIRNTDRGSPIFLKSVEYYDTGGQLIETFLDGMYGLAPLASASITINVSDTRGGFGANFIVEWGAQEPVSDPIMETVMIGNSGTQGFSFTSPARIVQSDDQ